MLALLLAGCRCGGAATDAGTDAAELPDGLVAYNAAYCAWLFRCESAFGAAFADEAACQAWGADFLSCFLAGLPPGAFAPDQAVLDGCIADLDAAPCDPTASGPTCEGLFEVGGGTGLEGDACGRRYECAPGHFCEVVDAICTACRAEAALGEDCMFRYCQDGLHCDPATLVCAAPSAPGENCDEPPDCASGFCDFGLCAPRLALGAPCGIGAVCEGQLGCIEGTCALRRPATAACDDDDDCWLDHWCVAGSCTFHDYCAARPSGQRCEGTGSGGCAAGLYCDTMNVSGFVCQIATAPGELCSASPECGPGAFCDFIGGAMVCATYAPAGGACTSAFDCAGELFCSAGDVCTIPGADGAACDNANECETGYCSPGGGLCGPYPVCP